MITFSNHRGLLSDRWESLDIRKEFKEHISRYDKKIFDMIKTDFYTNF